MRLARRFRQRHRMGVGSDPMCRACGMRMSEILDRGGWVQFGCKVTARRLGAKRKRGCTSIDTHALSQRVGCSRKAVLAACVALVAEGALVARGRGRSSAWADPGAPQGAVLATPGPPRSHAYDPRLRQIAERQPRKSAPSPNGGSFWVGLDRHALTSAIAAHQDRMSHSSMASRVDPSSRERE